MYICQNPKCDICLKKGTFPDAGNCILCNQPLVPVKEEPVITSEDQELLNSLPYVIAYPLKKTITEEHALTRISNLKDTFYNYLKYLVLLAASEFFSSPSKDKRIAALFQQKLLLKPSYGDWNHFYSGKTF